jgi:hypothetical protein
VPAQKDWIAEAFDSLPTPRSTQRLPIAGIGFEPPHGLGRKIGLALESVSAEPLPDPGIASWPVRSAKYVPAAKSRPKLRTQAGFSGEPPPPRQFRLSAQPTKADELFAALAAIPPANFLVCAA